MARRPEGGSVIMRSRAAVTGTQIVGEDGPSLPVTAWSHNESQQLATVGTTTARVNRLTQTFSWSKLKCFTVTHGPSMDPGVEEATQILSWSRHTQHNAEHFYFVPHLSGARVDCGVEGAWGRSWATQLCLFFCVPAVKRKKESMWVFI